MKDIVNNSKKSPIRKKEKVVRATFSLPGSALIDIDAIRKKLAMDGYILNKSEVVRVGLAALDTLSERHIKRAIGDMERLKAGRPNSKA